MNHSNKRGFTLIEVIIYVALLMFIMGSGVVAAFYVVDSSANGKAKISTLAEAGFLMRKIDWALTGDDSIDLSQPGVLSVNKNGYSANPVVISLDIASARARISEGGSASLELTTDRVKVSSLTFESIPAAPPRPAGVVAHVVVDGMPFDLKKYLRK